MNNTVHFRVRVSRVLVRVMRGALVLLLYLTADDTQDTIVRESIGKLD